MTTNRSEKLKKDLNRRLNITAGQIKGIQNMLENDAYCTDILIQLMACRSALSSISKIIIENHLKSCLIEQAKTGDDEAIDDFMKNFSKFLQEAYK
ncbi:MAG: metal-sensing transcriptional repressor [Defluviitaleaceae bacterium]|nr:metal-sensing transcriptional repressor [Defluviitaleaceae bacterium]